MDSQRAARVATFSVGIAVASYAAYQLGKLVQRKRHDAKNSTSCVELRPPFPDEVVQLLRSSVLCYLSTLADGAPHLSLMNFTYCPSDEKIIMSTRRDTTKYRALLKNKRVAVLIHDFPAEERQRAAAASAKAAGRSGDYAQTYSVTLYGSVQVETGAAAAALLALRSAKGSAAGKAMWVLARVSAPGGVSDPRDCFKTTPRPTPSGGASPPQRVRVEPEHHKIVPRRERPGPAQGLAASP